MTTPTIRPLTADETRALAAARLIAVETCPYLAHALFAVRPLAAEGLDTFAVDRHWRLYMDPASLAEWGPQTTGAVLVHEINHLLREHADRADNLPGPLDHDRWNLATDAAINDDLLKAGLPLPSWVVTPATLGLPEAGLEETYYAALPAQPPQSEPGCGSGAGDPHQPWEPAPNSPTAPGLDSAQVTITRRRVAEHIHDTATHSRGTIPAGLTRWADNEITTPTIPWRKLLAATVRRACALTTGRTTYTYTRPGRRNLPHIITPAMRGPKITAAAIIDTSASMSPDDLTTALAEVSGVIKAAGGRITVLTCDAATGLPQRVNTAHRIHLTGGGGTDMRVGIAAAEHLTPAPDVITVITDGYTPWPDTPTRARLIAVLTTDRARRNVPTWARTLIADKTI